MGLGSAGVQVPRGSARGALSPGSAWRLHPGFLSVLKCPPSPSSIMTTKPVPLTESTAQLGGPMGWGAPRCQQQLQETPTPEHKATLHLGPLLPGGPTGPRSGVTCRSRSRHTQTCRKCSRSHTGSTACSAGNRGPGGRGDRVSRGGPGSPGPLHGEGLTEQ